MRKYRYLTPAAAAVLFWTLLGCSMFGSPEPVDETHQGTLTDSSERLPDDNSPFDSYEFEAGSGWTVTIDMMSTEFDTYLLLEGPGGVRVAQDDDGGEGTNARISYTTTASGTHKVIANSYSDSGRGAYTLRIVANPT